jgi:hypothetical protein
MKGYKGREINGEIDSIFVSIDQIVYKIGTPPNLGPTNNT